MDLKATIASSYRNRLLLIAIAAMLYASWCLYDALVAYPDKIEAREAFEQAQKDDPDNWNTETWPKVARENGWDGTKEPEAIASKDIVTQWVQFGIVFPIGSYCLFSMAMWSRRYLGADEAKLYSHTVSDGVPFDAITRIDAARWDNKGIALVYFDAGQGEQSIVIDDWKYVREPSDAIFDRLRANVAEDKFTGLIEPSEESQSAPEEAVAE